MTDVVMNSWLRLTVISLGTSGLFVAVFAIVMIARDGLDVTYCPSLPAGHFLPCMPSITGVAAAVLLTIICAVTLLPTLGPTASHRRAVDPLLLFGYGDAQDWTFVDGYPQVSARCGGKMMKRFAEVLPAAGLALLLIVLMSLQLLGFDFVGRWTQTTVGAISLIFGLLILGLCITGPLIWGVLYFLKRTGRKP